MPRCVVKWIFSCKRFLSACAIIATALLTSCGSTGKSSTTPNPGPSVANGPNRVYAVFPPVTSNDSNFNDFNAYVLANPNVAGVTVGMPWNAIESDTTPGSYDFSALDAKLQHFIAAGKTVNLIVEPVREGGVNNYTPTYVFGSSWAASVSAAPLDVVSCNSYPGDGVNLDSGMPVVYEAPFQTAYKNFIAAVVQHYTNNASVPIGYIRFGLVMGGEAAPLCSTQWPGYSQTAFLNYVQDMMRYESSLNPPMQILANIHFVDSNTNTSYADAEAQYAVQFGFGFGNNGLQKSDIANYGANALCNADWCAMFNKYLSSTMSDGKPIQLELQTLGPTDPTGASPTGSLADLLPFAAQRHCNLLELWPPDLLLAFDPNYSRTSGANSAFASFAGDYASAIQSFVSGQ
ncbi:MAG TPA: hypothetical protein VFA89_09830 [Terriglobales bacterium]|nr:hypothetical protein [Terriglobales bacterium]